MLIFINQGKVESIVYNAPPCQSSRRCPVYSSAVRIDAVLELPGGRAEELKLAQ